MRRTIAVAGALVALSAGLVASDTEPGGAAPGDVKVSDQSYVRYDGGTDATLAPATLD